MLKKLTAIISAISIAVAAMPILVQAEETGTKEVIHYECNEVTSGSSRQIYNAINRDAFPLTVFTETWMRPGHIKVLNVNDITYPEKSYVESWNSNLSWFQNIMLMNDIDQLKNVFSDGFAVNMWFKPIFEGNSYRRFVLLEARVSAGDPLFRVMYDANGDGAGNGRIIVTRKVNDGTKDSYNEYHFPKTLDYDKWHNVSLSMDESDGLNMPVLLIDGESLSVYDPENKIPTKDQGYKVVGYDSLTAVRIGQGAEINTKSAYNAHIGFSDISMYDGPRTESDMLEDYEKNIGYYEPEYDVKIKDGLGADASKSGLNDIFAGDGLMPQIIIDTSKVENTDTALFNSDNIKVTDITDNKELNTVGTLNDKVYTVKSNEYVPGHKYILTINPAVNEIRTKNQTLEFATTAVVPQVVARYDMNKSIISSDGNNISAIEDSISGIKTQFEGTFNEIDKYSNAYFVNANWAIREDISDQLREALGDEFTVDLWFKPIPDNNKEERIWSVGRKKSGTDNGNIHMMLNRKGAMLGFRVNYKYTENNEEKEENVQYLTTNTTNYYNNSGWNHLIFAYDTKTNTKSAVLNGHELVFDTKTYKPDASTRDTSTEQALHDGAKPYTMNENANMYLNGTVNIDGTWGGFVSRYYIGKQTYYNKAASTTYMNYLGLSDSDKYDTAYDLTLLQKDKELTREDLSLLTKESLIAQITMEKTESLTNNVYLESEQGNIEPEIVWNEAGTEATITFNNLTAGQWNFVINKNVTDAAGNKIRNTDYVIPITVMSQTEIFIRNDNGVVDPGTKVTGNIGAFANLVDTNSAVLVVARYNNDELVKIESTNEISEDMYGNPMMSIWLDDAVKEGETVKVMLWNDLNGMTPIVACNTY